MALVLPADGGTPCEPLGEIATAFNSHTCTPHVANSAAKRQACTSHDQFLARGSGTVAFSLTARPSSFFNPVGPDPSEC
jgi:hypothetical protein